MASSLTMTVEGVDRLASRLTALANQVGFQTVGHALRAEAEIEMTEAKRRTPVLTGALRASGHVTGPRMAGRVVEVVMGFGNASVDYAVKVHEMTNVFHRNGQAKYLESVLLESVPYLAQRVANRIRVGLGSSFGPSRGEVAQSRAASSALQSAIDMQD